MMADWINGVVTVAFVAVFAGATLWAYSARNRERFEHAARLPLDDDAPPASNQGGTP